MLVVREAAVPNSAAVAMRYRRWWRTWWGAELAVVADLKLVAVGVLEAAVVADRRCGAGARGGGWAWTWVVADLQLAQAAVPSSPRWWCWSPIAAVAMVVVVAELVVLAVMAVVVLEAAVPSSSRGARGGRHARGGREPDARWRWWTWWSPSWMWSRW